MSGTCGRAGSSLEGVLLRVTGRSHACPLVAQRLGTEGLCGPHTARPVVGLEEVTYLKFVTSQHWVASWLLLLSL